MGNDEFAWAQRRFLKEIETQYNQEKPVRIIVLKARQLGISTAMQGVLFWWGFIHKGSSSLVIAHENDASEYLFSKTKLYWETFPWHDAFTAKHSTQRSLSFEETKSTIRVATAKNVQTGRGRTLHAVHASECGFYPEPEALMVGLRQTIPNKHGSIIVLESTANGVGNWFHNEWLRAEEGKSDFVPLFFPWFQHYEYRLPTSLCTETELFPEEKELLKYGADYENIAWRRWALPNLAMGDEEYFAQEYPAYPEQAFIATGTNVFPLKALELVYQPDQGYKGMLISDDNTTCTNPRFIPDHSGCLTVFKRPHPKYDRQRYFIAGDPSMTISGDPACIQVINRATMEQVAVWHGRIDPINFAKEMMLLGRWYHDAELCPEVEGGGQATVACILTSGYPSVWQHQWADKAPGKPANAYGWATNWNRKNWCIGRLKSLVADQSLVIHDQKTYTQMRSYVVKDNGDMGNANDSIHDDGVMALAICVTASMSEGPYVERKSTQDDILNIFNDGEVA